ncbi:MAG: eL32 family ribosomal protein [Candidatus Lokiarchaeota archaeon]
MKKNRLLELRKNKKRKNPKFRRVESWRYKRVKDSWRKARGIDLGYRGPKKVRGLHPSGYEEVRIASIDEIKGLSNKKHALKISGSLGTKKRISLVEYAQNRGFRILNMGISQRELESFESMLQSPIEDLEDEIVEGEDFEDSLDLED